MCSKVIRKYHDSTIKTNQEKPSNIIYSKQKRERNTGRPDHVDVGCINQKQHQKDILWYLYSFQFEMEENYYSLSRNNTCIVNPLNKIQISFFINPYGGYTPHWVVLRWEGIFFLKKSN